MTINGKDTIFDTKTSGGSPDLPSQFLLSSLSRRISKVQPKALNWQKAFGKILLVVIVALAAWSLFDTMLRYGIASFNQAYNNDWSPIPFASKGWRSQRDGWGKDDPTRYRMLHSLLNEHKIVGLSRTEIFAMLGEPDMPADANSSILTYYFKRRDGDGSLHLRFEKDVCTYYELIDLGDD
jgi:hypothetical protein